MTGRAAAPALLFIAATALLAGCSTPAPARVEGAATEPPVAPAAAFTSPALASAAPAATLTVTSTAAGVTVTAMPPPATPEPAPTDGPCPYLADDAVAEINGQHTGTTQFVAVQPYPICVFHRSDGEFLASVRIISADTPQAAVAAVDAHVPIESSDPASQPPGWTGGSMATDTGSVYAVAKGSLAIVAESNQRQSIKGRQMVVAVVGNLQL